MTRKNNRVKSTVENSAKSVPKTNDLKAKEAASQRKANEGDNTDLLEYGLMSHKGKVAK